ncbi:hypothetical protein RFI_08242, partial [Reticulomyxa filosa]
MSGQGQTKLSSLRHVTFLGGGAMGNALAEGLVTSGVLPKGCRISISDPYTQPAAAKKHPNCVTAMTDNIKAIESSDLIFLCVKPNLIVPVMKQVAPHLKGSELIVSIAAGVQLSVVESILQKKQKVLRLMPNIPALVHCMAGGICAGKHATTEDVQFI